MGMFRRGASDVPFVVGVVTPQSGSPVGTRYSACEQ